MAGSVPRELKKRDVGLLLDAGFQACLLAVQGRLLAVVGATLADPRSLFCCLLHERALTVILLKKRSANADLAYEKGWQLRPNQKGKPSWKWGTAEAAGGNLYTLPVPEHIHGVNN